MTSWSGWKPLGAFDVLWPSGLALGPLGWLQVLNFAFFGPTLIFFALGLRREVTSRGRLSWAGPAFLGVSGVALVLAAFKTDPHLMEDPQTWHGTIHLPAFVLLVLSFLLSLFFWWRRLGRDPAWRGYALYTLITAIVYTVLLFASTPGNGVSTSSSESSWHGWKQWRSTCEAGPKPHQPHVCNKQHARHLRTMLSPREFTHHAWSIAGDVLSPQTCT
jgi:hypothetical protein